MSDKNKCCGTCAWGRTTSLDLVNCEMAIPNAAIMISAMLRDEGATCPTYKPKEQPMTDPLEQTEQQRQAIAAALEELEAAANAWVDFWEIKKSEHGMPPCDKRIINATIALREARNPKPSPVQRMQAIEESAHSALLEKQRLLHQLQVQTTATPDQLAQIEKWEREIEVKI